MQRRARARHKWSLVLAGDLRVPVRAGVSIGRHYECDLVIDNEHVSRRHAHVRPSVDGLELVPLGRNPVTINRVERAELTALAAGDVISIGDVSIRVELGPELDDDDRPWLVEHAGTSVSLRRVPFAIGGGEHDDLVVPGCPAASVRVYRVDNAIFVEAELDVAQLDDRALAPGVIEAIADGTVLRLGDHALTFRQPAVAATPTRPIVTIPDRVVLKVLPRGARLTLTLGAIERTLVIAERRLELLSVLLAPPPPHRPGGYIPDPLIVQRVWPRSDRADTSDLHVLVHRLRTDLIKVGINGLAIIARDPSGIGTRFTLRPDTEIVIG
jgi:hypothetical protein